MLVIMEKCNYAKLYTYSEKYSWNTACTAEWKYEGKIK